MKKKEQPRKEPIDKEKNYKAFRERNLELKKRHEDALTMELKLKPNREKPLNEQQIKRINRNIARITEITCLLYVLEKRQEDPRSLAGMNFGKWTIFATKVEQDIRAKYNVPKDVPPMRHYGCMYPI